jgi:hypothetical protein
MLDVTEDGYDAEEVYRSDHVQPVYSPVEHIRLSVDESMAAELLDQITAPKLVKLELFFRGFDIFDFGKLEQFLYRSGCTLTSLLFEDLIWDPDELISLLRSLPFLVEFTLQERIEVDRRPDFYIPMITDNLFSAMVINSPSDLDVLLPRLQRLKISIMRPGPFSLPASFVDAVVSRSTHSEGTEAGIYRLESVDLKVPSDTLNSTELERLRSISDAGIALNITNYQPKYLVLDLPDVYQ